MRQVALTREDLEREVVQETAEVRRANALVADRWWVFTEREDCLVADLRSELAERGYRNIRQGADFLYATGSVPICLVAHADTVHIRLPRKTEIFHDTGRGVLWSPVGLGADDRAGVLGILELLDRGYRPHVLITQGEECGGTGADEFLETVPDAGVAYFLELDRAHADDAVFYGCNNKKFIDYCTDFGFVEANGLFTDISTVCPEWQVAGVNLSVGYYEQHTKTEYLVLPELLETLDKVERMLCAPPAKRFKYGSPKVKDVKRWGYSDSIGVDDYYAPRYERKNWQYVATTQGIGAVDRALSAVEGTLESRVVEELPRSSQPYEMIAEIDIGELQDVYGGSATQWEGILEELEPVLRNAARDALIIAVEEELENDPSLLRLLSYEATDGTKEV